MIFSERKKFIFIHVPKTAGKAVENLLIPFDDKVKETFFRKWRRRIHTGERPINEAYFRRHDSAVTVRRILGSEVYEKHLSFAFVRNPYDHAWSHYRYMKQLGTSAANRARTSGFSEFLYWRLENQGKFSQEFQKNNWFGALPNLKYFVCDLDGKPIVDRVLRLERMDIDMRSVCDVLGLEFQTVARVNVTQSSSNFALEDFEKRDPEAIQLIEEIYDEDFSIFGYPRDPKKSSLLSGF